MSLSLTLYKNSLKRKGFKKWTEKPKEELEEKVKAYNDKHAFDLPKENYDHLFSKIEIQLVINAELITFPIIRMVQKTPANKAILCAPGNELPLNPTQDELETAWKLGDETHRDVWVPMYPRDNRTINAQTACLYEVYKEMLKYYKPKAIDFFGYSLGASLMIDFFPFNNSHEQLESPRFLFLVSPIGNAVGKENMNMKKIAKKDPLMTYQYGKEILTGSDDFTHFRHLDLSNTPETWLFYGDCDIYCAKASSIITSFKMDLIPIHTVVRKELPHAYLLAPSIKEVKEDYQEIIEAMKREDQL
jgi:hypothetical protein